MKNLLLMFLGIFLIIVGSIGLWTKTNPKPSDILGFKPVCETSTRQEIVVAQAFIQEIYEIPCKPDGKWGPEIANAQCYIWCMKEKNVSMPAMW